MGFLNLGFKGLFSINKKENKEVKETLWTEKQLEVLQDPANFKFLYGGFGSGKSLLAFFQLFQWIDENPAPAMILGYSAETLRKRIREAINDLGLNIKIGQNANFFMYNGVEVNIYGADSSTQESRIRSLNYSYMLVEEPTAVGFSYDAFTEAFARLRVGTPKAVVTTNPSTPMHWTYQNIVKGNMFKSWQFSTFDNPKLKPTTEEFVTNLVSLRGQKVDTPWYKQFILGDYIEDGYELFSIGDDIYTKERVYLCYAFIDLSYSADGDYTALTLASFQTYMDDNGKKQKRIIVDGKLFRNRNAILKEWADIQKKYMIREVYYDSSHDAHFSFIQELIGATSQFDRIFKVIPLGHESVPKEAKIVSHIGWALGNKKILFNENIDKDFIEQVKEYRGELGNRKYKLHDDAPDSLACLIRELRTRRASRVNKNKNIFDVLY